MFITSAFRTTNEMLPPFQKVTRKISPLNISCVANLCFQLGLQKKKVNITLTRGVKRGLPGTLAVVLKF